MAGVSIEFQIGEIGKIFEELQKKSDDLFPLMDAIGGTLASSAVRRITQTNIAPDGTPWKVSARARKDGGKTLFESGRLAASITHSATSTSSTVGTNSAYGGIHQLGGTIKVGEGERSIFRRVNKAGTGFNRNGRFVKKSQSNFEQGVRAHDITIPARPYLGVDAQDGQEIQKLALDFIDIDGALS